MSEVLSFVGKARSALPSRFPLVMMVAGLRVVVHRGRQTLPRSYACVKSPARGSTLHVHALYCLPLWTVRKPPVGKQN